MSTSPTGSSSNNCSRRSAVDVVQIDAARVGGINENIAILLLAAKFGVPVCPHAGGVGLCEMVQHLAMFDFVAVSGTTQDRVLEYVDHLHEHFVDPVRVRQGRYLAAISPRTQRRDASLSRWRSTPIPTGRFGRSAVTSRGLRRRAPSRLGSDPPATAVADSPVWALRRSFGTPTWSPMQLKDCVVGRWWQRSSCSAFLSWRKPRNCCRLAERRPARRRASLAGWTSPTPRWEASLIDCEPFLAGSCWSVSGTWCKPSPIRSGCCERMCDVVWTRWPSAVCATTS